MPAFMSTRPSLDFTVDAKFIVCMICKISVEIARNSFALRAACLLSISPVQGLHCPSPGS